MIADLIIEKMPLIKVGKLYFGQCPLCKSNTFCVNNERNKFDCFECKITGSTNEFTYLMGGIVPPVEIQIDDFKQKVFNANQEILNLFKKELVDNADAQKYIHDRNIPTALIDEFHLGFSSGKCWDIINKYPQEILLATGAFKLKDNKIVPLFFHRLMFPIFDIMGNIIGWGGRKIDDSNAPKYINSPESVVYQKRYNLFGMNFAKEHANDGIIVCEGYMDVASLHNGGFKNAVASLGTALTSQQIEMIRHYTNKLYLCYDNDNAGLMAIKRAMTLSRIYNFDVKIISMTEYKDADEYMQNDREAFKDCIRKAKDIQTFCKDIAASYNSNELLNLLIEKTVD